MPDIFTRSLGAGALEVPALTLGSWHTWDRTSFEETVAVLRTAVDAGASFFDVGVYRSPWPAIPDSPTDIIFARAVQAAGIKREDYTLQVKGWLAEDTTPQQMRDQIESCLFRIGTDHAEIVIFGDLVGPHQSFDVIAECAKVLVDAGLVRQWGVNNWSAREIHDIATAAARAGVAAPVLAQLKYGLVRRSIGEGEPFAGVISDYGLKVQASDSLDGGYLLGKKRQRMIGNDPGGIHPLIDEARPKLQAIADELGCSLAALATSYLLTNDDLGSVLVGARTVEQAGQHIEAFDVYRRVGAERLRELLAPFWLDKGRVDPASSWGTTPDDDPATYQVIPADPVEPPPLGTR